MAEILRENIPTQKTYDVRLTQEEIDLLSGLVNDLVDTPRKVTVLYGFDEEECALTEKGLAVAEAISKAFLPSMNLENYDYYDYWESV